MMQARAAAGPVAQVARKPADVIHRTPEAAK